MIRYALIVAILPTWVCADSLTTVRMIRPSTVIGANDLGIVETVVPGALDSSADIVGMEARVMLFPGRPIRQGDVGPAALVERNQPVRLTFATGGLTIHTDGRALSRGAAGDMVRVMNLGSRMTVSGQVQPDGSVRVGAPG